MDNSLLLLILVKHKVNIRILCEWYIQYIEHYGVNPNYHDYNRAWGELMCTKQDFGDLLNDFEFNYVITSFTLYNVLDLEKLHE